MDAIQVGVVTLCAVPVSVFSPYSGCLFIGFRLSSQSTSAELPSYHSRYQELILYPGVGVQYFVPVHQDFAPVASTLCIFV